MVTIEEIQASAELATQPQTLEDGTIYVPVRVFPTENADRVRYMMQSLGIADPRLLQDRAMEMLDWVLNALDQGYEVGAVKDDVFVPAKNAIDWLPDSKAKNFY